MLEFRILGPLEVWDGEKALELGGQRQRAVLAILAMHVGEVVPSERLITYLWGESPPPTAATSLQNAVSQLRKSLGADVVETRTPGYALNAEKDAVDARRFERLLSEARSADGRATGFDSLRTRCSSGAARRSATSPTSRSHRTEAARLDELRLTAIEERIEAELELGSAAELVGELEAIVREHPLRERPRGQLMLALYRSGRQAEALQAYQDTRRMLVEELGIEPTPALQQLHASILRQESALQPQIVPGAGEDQLGEVVRALLSGRLVHVLGPGPSSENGESLAGRLAEAFDCPEEHRGDLTRVSQYVAVTQGVGPLYDQLHDLFVEGDEPGPVERFLATLPELARATGRRAPAAGHDCLRLIPRARVRGARRGRGSRLLRRDRPEPR